MIQEGLAKTLDGGVLAPGDAGYDAARAVWNAMVDRRPRLIARCRIALARRTAAALDPFARGQYVNTLSDEGAEGVRRAYPPGKLARLTAIKDQYDPENVFHLNHNIRPSAQSPG
jgi:hypothetical protein